MSNVKSISLPKDLQEFKYLFEELFPNHDFSWREYPNRTMGLCPFHEEKRHSFNIFQAPDGTFCYKCFGCGESGTVYKLLKQFGLLKDSSEVKSYGNPLYPLAVEFVKLAQRELLSLSLDSVRIEILFNKIYKKANGFEDKEKKQLLSSIVDYFGIGIITEELIENCRSHEDLNKFITELEEKIYIEDKIGYFIFPYFTLSGHIISLKFRDLEGSSRTSRVYKLYKSAVPSYFGGLGFLKNYVKQRDGEVLPVFITEGETDSMSFFADSFFACLCVGSASNYKYLLDDRVSQFDFFPIILPDFDPYTLKSAGAGREAIIKLYEERRQKKIREKIYVLVSSESYAGGKDVNDAINVYGKSYKEILNGSIEELTQARKTLLEEYKEWKYEQFLRKKEKIEKNIPSLANVYADYLSITEVQEKKEFSVEDIESIDKDVELILNRFPVGKTSVVASFGGVGKTTYAIILAYEIATKEGKRVLFWTTEHSPESIKRRITRIKETPELQEFYEQGKGNVFFKTDIPDPLVNSKKELNKNAFNELKKLIEKYDVLILDPYLTFVEGEENDNVIARKTIKKIHSILSEFEGKAKAVIFLHHFGKLALREALLDEEDIEERSGKLIRVSREKVEELIKSVRGASAIVDTARYVEAIVLTRENRERYIVTIKTNEETREEGYGEKIPELISVQGKKEQLFERVRRLVLSQKLYVDDARFEQLEHFGIYTYSDFEELYKEVPLKVLENFVEELEEEFSFSESTESEDDFDI